MKASSLATKIDVAVIAIVACFVFFASLYILLPGVWDEETRSAKFAMQMLLTNGVDGYSVTFFGKQFLLAEWVAEGGLQAYSLLPFFAAFGVGVESERLSCIVYSAIGLVFFYFFGRRTFSRRAAIVSTISLASMPSFLFVTRLGTWAPSILFLAVAMLLWSMAELYWGKRSSQLYVCAFLAGLGMNSKLVFLWLINAIIFCTFFTRKGRVVLQSLGIRKLCFAVFFFIAGSLPFASFAVLNSSDVLGVLSSTSRSTLSTYPEHAPLRIEHLYDLLIGKDFAPPLFGTWYPNLMAAVIFAIAFLLLCAFVVMHLGKGSIRRPETYLLLLFVILLVQTPISPTHYVPVNLWILLPLVALVVGAVAERSACLGRRGSGAVTIMILMLIVSNCATTTQYYASLSDTSGPASQSLVSYCIAAYLDQLSIVHPIAMDWGFANSIPVLTQNRIRPIDNTPWWGTSNSEWIAKTKEYVRETGNSFLFWREGWTEFRPFQDFSKIALDIGKRVELETYFVATDGTVMARIFRVDTVATVSRIDCASDRYSEFPFSVPFKDISSWTSDLPVLRLVSSDVRFPRLAQLDTP